MSGARPYCVGVYTDLFEQVFPYYLAYGMTAEQFWTGDPYLTLAYQRKDELLRQRRSEDMWMQGAYIYKAVGTCLANAFRKKGTKPQPYMEKPIRVIPYTEEEKQKIAEEERKKAIEYFNNMQKRFQKGVIK